MTVWFSSDHHFSHKNVLIYAARPYVSVKEMDHDMILRWNRNVGKDDTVYYLGDFTLGGRDTARKFMLQLNGHIHFVCPLKHHDQRWLKAARNTPFFSASGPIVIEPPLLEITIDRTKLIMCHFPLASWPGWDRGTHGTIHLYGHSHGRLRNTEGLPIYYYGYEVGVDVNAFRPVHLSEIREVIEARKTLAALAGKNWMSNVNAGLVNTAGRTKRA